MIGSTEDYDTYLLPMFNRNRTLCIGLKTIVSAADNVQLCDLSVDGVLSVEAALAHKLVPNLWDNLGFYRYLILSNTSLISC